MKQLEHETCKFCLIAMGAVSVAYHQANALSVPSPGIKKKNSTHTCILKAKKVEIKASTRKIDLHVLYQPVKVAVYWPQSKAISMPQNIRFISLGPFKLPSSRVAKL